MNLRRGFMTMAISLSTQLLVIAGITWSALSAFDRSTQVDLHRQSSLALMSEVRHEVDLLGRLVNSYVSTSNPRYLHYYYDILAIREGAKPRPIGLPPAFWDEVIAGGKPYVLPAGTTPITLLERTQKLGFDAQEQVIVSHILALTERMKSTEQVAFAATQGLYDPEKDDFVSETTPQPAFANKLLHQADYLKLRADLAVAVEELSSLVDKRTQNSLSHATNLLENWITASLGMLVLTIIWLIFGYRYLRRNLLKPLTALHRTATALAGKSYDERVGNIRGVDEVKTLATTIDGMAAAIEADIGQREITQRELREARARAEVATEAKSIFLANMSHEIRTPMNAILGMAYLALKSDLPPRQRDQVDKIHSAARTLLGILNDILDFSKIEAGKINLEKTPFVLEEVASNALSMIQQRACEKQLELIFSQNLPKNSCHFIGDPLRLGQVLINLLSNAVKFTADGHVALRIEQLGNSDKTSSISFTIEDTGIGMTQEQIEGLFQEFSQADGSTTRKYGGTGLGLSISKRLVEAMGGNILVTSNLEQGSAFSFTLSLATNQHAETNPPMLHFQRALVVDDYAPSRTSMAELLRQLGCQTVETAVDGSAAISQIQNAFQKGESYDLLLLDWLMPGMSGSETLLNLHSKHIPLPMRSIVVSAMDYSLLRDEVAVLGVSEVLQKPLLPTMLSNSQTASLAMSQTRIFLPETVEKPLNGMRILAVDDDPINRQIAEELLRDWGAEVSLSADGAAALNTIEAQAPGYFNLVLMDLEMPIMNGHTATKHLRANPRFSSLPILAMTAHAVGAEVDLAMQNGMNGHIPKPFDPDNLLSILRTYHHKDRLSNQTQATGEFNIDLSDIPAPILTIPEINTTFLIQRFHGRRPFLERMLKHFMRDFENFQTTQEIHLATGDIESAMRQAHSLKGLAGTFGMTRLQAAALAVEKSLRNNNSINEALQTTLNTELQCVLSAIAQMAIPDDVAAKIANPMETQRLLRHLHHHLSEANGEAEALWTNNKAQFVIIFSAVEFATIERAIGNWDFDQALSALSLACKNIEQKHD